MAEIVIIAIIVVIIILINLQNKMGTQWDLLTKRSFITSASNVLFYIKSISLHINGSRFASSFDLACGANGFILKPNKRKRLGLLFFSPVFIPWEAISKANMVKIFGLDPCLCLYIQGTPSLYLFVPQKFLSTLKTYVNVEIDEIIKIHSMNELAHKLNR